MGSWQRAQEENGLELFSTTLAALFAQASPTGWNTSNTNGKLPVFHSDENTKSLIVNEAQQGVSFEEGNTRWRDTQNGKAVALDDSQGDRETEVIITIYAANKYYRELFELEVERILRQNRPGNGVTILKSDGINDSAILGWSFPLPDWNNFELGLNRPERAAKTQMILKVHWQANWV